jgi:hypothetical protein
MARPMKKGLSYFPFDSDFFSDIKIRCLRGKFSTDGVMVFIFLLCTIYQNGYYIDLNDDLIYIISDELKLSEGRTRLIVDYLIKGSLLQCISLDPVKVLTSAAIQRRYQEGKRTARKDIEVTAEFWVLKKEETLSFIKLCPLKNNTCNNADNTSNSPYNTSKNATKEKKGKEKKGKERKDKVQADKLPEPPSAIADIFNTLCTKLPPVTVVGAKRTTALNRLTDQYSMEEIKRGLVKVSESDFLNGDNQRNWKATFDWIIYPDNFCKILEGNYDNLKESDRNYGITIEDLESMANKF